MERIASLLIRQFEWDVAVMSQPWMYWTVVPMLVFLAFFFVKWVVLTAPLWLPLSFVAQAFRRGS